MFFVQIMECAWCFQSFRFFTLKTSQRHAYNFLPLDFVFSFFVCCLHSFHFNHIYVNHFSLVDFSRFLSFSSSWMCGSRDVYLCMIRRNSIEFSDSLVNHFTFSFWNCYHSLSNEKTNKRRKQFEWEKERKKQEKCIALFKNIPIVYLLFGLLCWFARYFDVYSIGIYLCLATW